MDSKNSGIAMMAGGALLAIGSFLEWASKLGVGLTPMDGGDGWFTLIAGVAVVALGFMTFRGERYQSWLAWVAIAVAAAVALINLSTFLGDDQASLGIGMYAMLAGVVIAVVGLVMGRKSAI